MVCILVQAGLRIVKESTAGPDANTYLNRDYLVVFERVNEGEQDSGGDGEGDGGASASPGTGTGTQ